jgi:hypothetical protein
VRRIDTSYAGSLASTAATWTLFLSFLEPAGSTVLNPALPNWTLAANANPPPITAELNPNLLINEGCRRIDLFVNPSGPVSRLVIGAVVLAFVPVRM